MSGSLLSVLGNAFCRVTDVETSSVLKAIPKRGNESASQIAKMNTNQVPAGVGRDGLRKEERGSTSEVGESRRVWTDCVEQAQKGHRTRTCPWCPHLEAKGLTSRILDSEPSSVGKRILPAIEESHSSPHTAGAGSEPVSFMTPR